MATFLNKRAQQSHAARRKLCLFFYRTGFAFNKSADVDQQNLANRKKPACFLGARQAFLFRWFRQKRKPYMKTPAILR